MSKLRFRNDETSYLLIDLQGLKQFCREINNHLIMFVPTFKSWFFFLSNDQLGRFDWRKIGTIWTYWFETIFSFFQLIPLDLWSNDWIFAKNLTLETNLIYFWSISVV